MAGAAGAGAGVGAGAAGWKRLGGAGAAVVGAAGAERGAGTATGSDAAAPPPVVGICRVRPSLIKSLVMLLADLMRDTRVLYF